MATLSNPSIVASHPVSGEKLRVLDLSFNYPHIAESYIDAEIRQLCALGANVVARLHRLHRLHRAAVAGST